MKNFFKRYLPHRDHIQKQGGMHLLSDYLHDPNIWHLHRRSTAGGAAVGMFFAFIPFPIQTLGSAACAILLRVNLPIAVVFSLFSNPITIPPIFFLSYKIGATLLGLEYEEISFNFSGEWLTGTLSQIWQPLLLGCFILGTISATITYFVIRLIWRLNAVSKWENRHKLKYNEKDNDSVQ